MTKKELYASIESSDKKLNRIRLASLEDLFIAFYKAIFTEADRKVLKDNSSVDVSSITYNFSARKIIKNYGYTAI